MVQWKTKGHTMLDTDADQFIREQIIPRWPKWKTSGVVCGDFKRQLKKIDSDTALEAIIRAKETSKTITYPVLAEFRSKISEVIRDKKVHTTKPNPMDKYIACYALNEGTGKYLELLAETSSNEGAAVITANYLRKYGYDPTEYTYFIGQENFNNFFNKRHDIRCPAVEDKYDDIPF